MTQFIEAIYEHGVFRPLEPVAVAEHERVSLVIVPAAEPPAAADAETLRRQKESLQAAFEEAAKLPIQAPDDGLGGADHDFILYGWKK